MNKNKKFWFAGLVIMFLLIVFVAVGSIAGSFGNVGGEGGKGMMVYEHEIEEEGIKSIEIGYVSEGITFYKTDEKQIKIVENLRKNGKKADISLENGNLKVMGDKRRGNLFNLFQFGFEREWVDVYIPAAYAGSLSLATVSGEIKTQDCWELSAFDGNGTSGNIYLEGMSAESVNVSSVSGKIEVKKLIGNASVASTSGNVILESDRINGTVSMSTVSGNVKIKVPKDSAFSYDANTVSGKIHTLASKGADSGNKKSVSGSYGGDSNNTISAGTVSGNIEIYY